MSLNSNWNSLSSIVHKAVKRLEAKGITHAEAFFTSSRTTEVSIRNSEILTQNRVDDSGVGFRVVVAGNKVGFACTNDLSEKAVFETGEKAFAGARISSAIKSFTFPEASEPPKVKGLYSSDVAEISVENVVEIAERAIDAAENFDKRVIAKDGRVVFQFGWRGIVNTLGVDFEEKETKAVLYLGGVGESDGEVTGGCFDLALIRSAGLKPEQVGESVGKMVTEMFGPKPLKSFQGPVIFGPEAVSYQIFDVLADALKGENVIAGRSAWTGKVGQMVASEDLAITDNATLEGGFASRSFDDEGCSSQNTSIVGRGKLQSFLHQASTAKALGAKNTRNASRFSGGMDMVHMIVGNGYRTKPEIYPSNLVIQPGSKTKEELVSEMTKGVLIEAMAGFAQEGSGIISAQLSRAFFVQNGAIWYPIKGGMVSGVGFDWFKQVSSVSKDVKHFPNAVVPSLLVENVKVAGA